jgi:Putative adhesin
MKYAIAAAAALSMAVLPALASEATFERNLQVNGRVELSVSTGSGNIHLTHGSGNQVHVFGKVKSNSWTGGASEDRVREIAANPPIEQTGNIIRIGKNHENLHNISIDYEIQAPADAFLDANSGSGDVNDDGVGENAKLGTGSGNIHATGLKGAFSVNTGSGNIFAEQSGAGDVKAQTGSGNVELRDLHGSLRAGTGSGDIKISGSPEGEWKLETGSGNVEFWPGSTGLTLDASTGSGTVHSDHEMTVQGSFDHHHITGKINGGGPTVRIQTGSGDVRIH